LCTRDEARKLAIAAARKMSPLPSDLQNPLANVTSSEGGGAPHDYLILWLAYKEANAMIQFDAPPAVPVQTKTK
jgi:hypothetical protein